MIKEFTIWKNNKKTKDTQPDYNICFTEDNTFKYVGVAWKRESNGKTFLSCKLRDVYQDKVGYHITEDKMNDNGTMKPDNTPQAEKDDLSDF